MKNYYLHTSWQLTEPVTAFAQHTCGDGQHASPHRTWSALGHGAGVSVAEAVGVVSPPQLTRQIWMPKPRGQHCSLLSQHTSPHTTPSLMPRHGSGVADGVGGAEGDGCADLEAHLA